MGQKNNSQKLRLCNTPHKAARREKIESELSAIPIMNQAMRKLLSAEGFADYYFDMENLYPSKREAYERLEDFHIRVTGHRKYSEFHSFRKTLHRKLKTQRSKTHRVPKV